MKIDDLKKLLEDLEDLNEVLKDASYTDAEKETAFNNVIGEIDTKVLKDDMLQSDKFKDTMNKVVNSLGKSMRDLQKNDEDKNRKGQLAGRSKVTNPMIEKLKNASKKLDDTQKRIVEAKSKEIDIENYIDTKEDEIKDLETKRDDLKKESKKVREPFDNLTKNDNYKAIDKVEFTVAKYKEYDKVLHDIAAERAKTPIDNDKVAQLESKRDDLKKVIKSSKCVSFEDGDTISIIGSGAVVKKSFKECLDKNESISLFINGTVERNNGGAYVAIGNLESIKDSALKLLRKDIDNDVNLEKIKDMISAKSYNTSTLTQEQLKEIVVNVEKEVNKARNNYLIAKHEVKIKEESIKTLKKEEKMLEDIDSNDSVNKIWKKYMTKSEKNELVSVTSTFRNRFNFWRGRGNTVAAFFNAFRKNKTINTMKYQQVETKRKAVKNTKAQRTNKFREELVKIAAKGNNDKVNEADMENAYKRVNEKDLDR